MPLINSDKWISRFISAKSLRFHPRNPRLPEIAANASEREIIHTLCLHGDVEAIAREISTKGYLRVERLIVVEENGKNIVYEGNRRLCALRVLDNPELAPPEKQATFRKLAAKAILPEKVAVEIVPSKFDAEIVMYAKHAGEKFMLKWKPLQQAAFIAGRLEEGITIEELREEHGFKQEEVLMAKAAIDFYKIVRTAPLSAQAKPLVDDPDKFPYSTLFERLVRPVKSRAALGINIDERGLTVSSEKKSFLKAVAKMFDDAAKGLDTRKLNTEPLQVEYARKLNVVPSDNRFTAEDFEAGSSVAKPTPPGTGKDDKKKSRSKPTSNRLFPRSLTVGIEHEKLTRLVKEGKKLDVELAHAAAMLLRVTVENALVVWLKRKKVWSEVRKLEKNPDHGPSLAVMLGYLNKNKAKFGLDPHIANALPGFVSKKIKHSKFELDRIAHLPEAIATSDNVVENRELILPFLQEILRDPNEATQP